MTCPVCKGTDARRSRRQDIPDYILSVMGVYPWRCQDCHTRFHGRKVSLSDALRAHCPICGNQDLKRISPDLVETHFAFFWRWMRIPAYRCAPCRHKYFSIRRRNADRRTEVEQLTPAD